jgi:hypothetical protein
LPDHVEIVTKRALNGVAQPHIIARTLGQCSGDNDAERHQVGVRPTANALLRTRRYSEWLGEGRKR